MPTRDSEILQAVSAALERGEEALLGVSGRSMLPTLRPLRKDLVVLRPVADGESLIYEIVLAALPDGRTVLHRCVGQSAGSVELMGDGNRTMREQCRHADVIGVVHRILVGGVRSEVPSRRFGRVWTALRPARPLLLRLYGIIKHDCR